MRRTKGTFFSTWDWSIVLIYGALVLIGWVNIYAASYSPEHPSIFDLDVSYGKQLMWIGVAVFTIAIIGLVESDFYQQFAYPIFGFTLLLLLGVLVFGKEINGNKSWFVLGPVSLQPAEFAKIGTALALSMFLSSSKWKGQGLRGNDLLLIVGAILTGRFGALGGIRFRQLRYTLGAFALVGLPAALILLQPDTGSTLVFAAFIFVLYREGLSGNILLLGLVTAIVFILALLFDKLDIVLALTGLSVVALALVSESYKLTIAGILLFAAEYLLVNYTGVGPEFILAGIGVTAAVYLLFLVFKRTAAARVSKIQVVGGFLLISGFVYSVDYIFTNVLKEHQRTRITVLLGEEDKLKEQIVDLRATLEATPDSVPEYQEMVLAIREKKQSLDNLKRGAGYNVNQSKIAIGSGGFVGKGFLQGTQTKFKFVPEQNTDFIFCTVGEEWGFVGSSFVIALFVVLMMRIIIVAERQRSVFARIYGYSVASIFFFHLAINLGMTMGLVPVIGIPLPFFSYGGSSLWAFTILLFIFLRLDSARMSVLR